MQKREAIRRAFVELGVLRQGMDEDPSDQADAAAILEDMMLEWDGLGIRLGYQAGTTDLDQDMGVPPTANSAVVKNLALACCPMFGIAQPKPTLFTGASRAYDSLLRTITAPPVLAYPGGLPRGSGYGIGARRFTPTPATPLGAGDGTDLNGLDL